jgi:hypothetical protein
MKIHSNALSGLAGAGISIIIGLLVKHLGAGGGVWGGLYDLIVLPAIYIHAVLLGFVFGTVEGSPAVFGVFFILYLCVLGFFIGAFSYRLRIGWKKHRANRENG